MKPTSKQITLISNSTSVQQVFGRVCQRFDKMFEHRAFMKHYIMSRTEEMELSLAREDLTTLHEFYDEIKAEKSSFMATARQQNRISYMPPDAVESDRKQTAD